MKCKPYSEITVEIRTQLKTVKITSNVFAVWVWPQFQYARIAKSFHKRAVTKCTRDLFRKHQV